MGVLDLMGERVGEVKVDSSSGGADVGFSPCGIEVDSMIAVPLSVGVNWILNDSPP